MNPTSQPGSAALACFNCRDRHVKCDGNIAGCARCNAAGISCYYLPSRRGRKRKVSQCLVDDLSLGPAALDMSSALDISSISPACGAVINDLTPWLGPSKPVDAENTTQSCPQSSSPYTSTEESSSVMLYYLYFHLAHPFLVPRESFLQAQTPKYLIDVVEFIGLHYISPALVNDERITHLQTTVQDAALSLEKVQALLLLSIMQHAHTLPRAAKQCLSQATECSLHLGLHRPDVSNKEMVRDPIRAESLRRTWWEVYVVDALLAAVQMEGTLHFTADEIPDVPLPCKQEAYNAGRFDHVLISARDLDSSRHLLHADEEQSSSAYRVEAAILLRRCLLATSQRSIDALDANIVAWFHRLPDAKRAILCHDGEADQMAFQATMLLYCASIYLHFPRSHLVASLPATRQLFCSSTFGFMTASPNPQLHTAKVHNAAISLSKLGSLTTSVVSHSPFFCCALVLSSITQIAIHFARAPGLSGTHDAFLGLNFGVLKSMGGIWRIAAVSRMRILDVVMEVDKAVGRRKRGQEDTFLVY